MMQKLFELIRSFFILSVFLYLGEAIFYLLPIGIPANIWGLLLLFLGLQLRLIPLNWVLLSAHLLVRYMAVLFLPISVGIIQYADLLADQFMILLLPNILSTIFALVGIGFFADYLFHRTSFSGLRRKVRNNSTDQKNK